MLLGLFGGWLVYYATRWGPWAFSDATGYVTAARNLLAGHGIGTFSPSGEFAPLVSHPPLFVLSLGLVSLLGVDPLVGARILDVAAFGLLTSGAGLLFERLTRSFWFGLAFSLLLLMHPAIELAYLSAMTEPVFLVVGLGALLLMALFLTRHEPWLLFASAALAGLATLTRYPGAAYVITGGAAVLISPSARLRVRIQHAVSYIAIGAGPVVAFLVWAAWQPNTEGPRALKPAIDLGPAVVGFVHQATSAVWTWKPIPPAVLLPTWVVQLRIPGLYGWLLGLGVAVGLALFLLQALPRIGGALKLASIRGSEVEIIKVAFIFGFIYIGFFFVAYVATFPVPDVNSRTLLPILPALMALILAGGSLAVRVVSRQRRSWVASLIAVGVIASCVGYAVISWDLITGLHRTGLGYTGRTWRESETMAAIADLPPDVPVVTNEPIAVTLLTGRVPFSITEIEQRRPSELFTSFASGGGQAGEAIREKGGALVLFDSIRDQLNQLYGDMASVRLAAFTEGLTQGFSGSDGEIYWFHAP